MSPKYRYVTRLVALVLVFCAISAAFFAWRQTGYTIPVSVFTGESFQELPVTFENPPAAPIPWEDLYDLGVTDLNGDNLFELFATHHSTGQTLLGIDEKGSITDLVTKLGLAQNPQFPGFVNPYTAPPKPEEPPGLYVYRLGDLHLTTHHLSGNASFGGRITMPIARPVRMMDHFDVFSGEQSKLLNGENTPHRDLTFDAQRSGHMVLGLSAKLLGISFPVTLTLNDDVPLDKVYLGPARSNPQSRSFSLFLRDRHGMAWADFDANDSLDVFIGRGGLKGRLDAHAGIVNDELLFNHDGDFIDGADQIGIDKAGCPSRQVAAVDFDGDSRLDIYVVCGRTWPPAELYPNQLFQQQSDGTFHDVAKEAGVDLAGEGSFLWVDADGDRDMDLLWAGNEQFELYVNQSGSFTPKQIGSTHKSEKKLTIADYDLDGDLDVFSASAEGNQLLTNTGSTFVISAPAAIGLPAASMTANWVDYDNDGLIDMHLVPDGLYRQRPDHWFEDTYQLRVDTGYWGSCCIKSIEKDVRSTWFDYDNDGYRDLVMHNFFIVRQWLNALLPKTRVDGSQFLSLFRNMGTPNHWLQLVLVGPRGNRQAIGARVEVATPTGVQVQQVGQSEGSHYSQGHYRLYFGLGENPRVNSVRIYWPDGHVQEVKDPSSDRLITINRQSKSR